MREAPEQTHADRPAPPGPAVPRPEAEAPPRRRAGRSRLPRASARHALGTLANVLLPTIAKGPIIRRPTAVAAAERFSLDDRAVRYVQGLRRSYGPGPLRIELPGLSLALVLEPEHVHRVLEDSPEPFAPASTLKRAALSHFQPHNVLISEAPARSHRREYHETILETPRPVHGYGGAFAAVVHEEAVALFAEVGRSRRLRWDAFAETWFRVVRRVVFGDAARDDTELTAMVDALRADGNWAFFKPRRHDLRRRFLHRVEEHLERAEPGSLAHVMAGLATTDETEPAHQVPQWLFAFDPAGMTTYRALALLTTHLEHEERARDEVAAARGNAGAQLPFLRATVLESLRLWPTTPLVLRRSLAATEWEAGTMEEGTEVLIYAPYFHRDDSRLPFAHRFAPELWAHERSTDDWPLIPFSSGPVVCPGRNLVLFVTSAMLSALLAERRFRPLPPHRFDPRRPLPGTLDNYSLEFELVA